MASAARLSKTQVLKIGRQSNQFLIQSENGEQFYQVYLGSDEANPSCECIDFLESFHPCKHMFAALFLHGAILGKHYLASAYFSLDTDCEALLEFGTPTKYSPRTKTPHQCHVEKAPAFREAKQSIKTLQEQLYRHAANQDTMKFISSKVCAIIEGLKDLQKPEAAVPEQPQPKRCISSRSLLRPLTLRKRQLASTRRRKIRKMFKKGDVVFVLCFCITTVMYISHVTWLSFLDLMLEHYSASMVHNLCGLNLM